MITNMTLGGTPCDEPCAQVGRSTYYPQAVIECKTYKKQLQRLLEKKFGENIQVRLRVGAYPHDFGTYHEVEVVWDDDNKEATQQAMWLDNSLPENWDEEALKELKTNGYTLHLVS